MQTMTETMRRELAETEELRLVDPLTSKQYVAIQEEVYEKIKETMDIRATYSAVIRAWDLEPDPGLASYQKYRRRP